MKIATLVLSALVPFPFLLQQAAEPAPAPEFAFAWLEGHWLGEGFGGVVEEVWLGERGGAMSGLFRLVVEDEVVLYEIVTLAETPDGPQMRLRHFGADLTAWEDKAEPLVWPALESDTRSARFGPVLYERRGEDELVAWVEVSRGETTETEKLVFRRVP